MPNPLIGLTKVDNSDIVDSAVPGTAITTSQPLNIFTGFPQSSADLLSGDGTFQTNTNVQLNDTNAFNIGLLGFKHAVNEGLTIFNLVDGVVDEFHDESGIDTPENSNATYDSSSDFYSNLAADSPLPTPSVVRQSFTSTGPATYEVPSGTTAVNVLVVGGGGGGGAGGYNGIQGGGGAAGGLIYYPEFEVTPGGEVAVTVGTGGGGGGFLPPSPGATPYSPTSRPAGGVGMPSYGGYENPAYNYPMTHTYYGPGQTGTDSNFGPLIGEGGGAGGGWLTTGTHPYFSGQTGDSLHAGGSGGADGGSPPSYTASLPGAPGTQASNHPIPLSPSVLPVNSPGSFGNPGGAMQPDSLGELGTAGGGGAGGAGEDTEAGNAGDGGIGLNYNIADGSTSLGYAGGGDGASKAEDAAEGQNLPFGGGFVNPSSAGEPEWYPGLPGSVNRGGGGAGGRNTGPSGAGGALGGEGGSGIVVVATAKGDVANNSLTLISDTFTALATPAKARIVVFAEIVDDLNTDITASITRDATNYNAVTLSDEGFQAGSSGIKIFTGSTPLTGAGSPQVALRWKIVGSSLTGTNKIHGVALQWA